MKIVGGTFGTSGGVSLSRDGYLVVKGAKTVNYMPENISTLDTRQETEKGRSVLSVLLGVLILTPVLFFLGGIVIPFIGALLGLIIGLWLTFAFSRTSSKNDIVDITFSDGERVELDCTPRAVKKLVQFKG